MLKLDFVAFTTDLWKNSTLSYFLGITAHFLDKRLNYQSLLVSFRKFAKSHYAQNLKSFIQKEISNEILPKVRNNSCLIK